MTAGPPPVAVALHRVRLPLHTPHIAAHGREDDREVILVSVTAADGTVGWGECPTLAAPGYGPEWTDGAWWVLSHVLAPAVPQGTAGHGVPGQPMSTGAVRDALLDLRLRQQGMGASAVLGPLAGTVPFGVAVGLPEGDGGIDATLAAVERAVEAGAGLVVLKVQPGWSVEPLRAVREGHPDLSVAVDANGSFSVADLDELQALDRWGPAFVEQPVAPADLAGSARVAAALDAPVALDEGIATPADLDAAVAVGAGSVLTVKASRAGGLEAAAALASRAAEAGWGVHGGGMLESGVGRSVARLVAALPAVTGPALVGPTSLLTAGDVAPPPPPSPPGTVAVHQGPGLGPVPDPALLAARTVDRWPRD